MRYAEGIRGPVSLQLGAPDMKEILEPRPADDNAWIPPEVWKPAPWWGGLWWSEPFPPLGFWYWRAERKHRWGHLLNAQGGYCCVCGKSR